MNVEKLSNCIICLDIGNSKNKLYPLPCHCNALIHKECFQQLEDDCCLICHQKNKYSDQNICLKKDNDVKTDLIDVNLENESVVNTFYYKLNSNLKNIFTRYFNCLKEILPCFYVILSIILYFLAAYITGITIRALLWILIRLPIYDISIVTHIASCILIGIITQFVIFKCCFDSSSE